MLIRKARAGNAPGHTWPEDGHILEVEDLFGEELLRIPNGGFTIAEQPEPETFEPDEDPGPAPETTNGDEHFTPPKTGRTGGRPRLPRDSIGNIIR